MPGFTHVIDASAGIAARKKSARLDVYIVAKGIFQEKVIKTSRSEDAVLEAKKVEILSI